MPLSSALPSVGVTYSWFFFLLLFIVFLYFSILCFLCWPFVLFLTELHHSQTTTNGRIVFLAWVRVGLKGISRVMSLSVPLALGIQVGLKGFETVMLLSAPCWFVNCSLYRTLPTFTPFFGSTSSFDEPCHLFDQFQTVIMVVFSPFPLFHFPPSPH